MTPTAAAVGATRFLRRADPKIVVVIGIAGCLGNELALGDVVVGTEIYDFLAEARAEDIPELANMGLATPRSGFRLVPSGKTKSTTKRLTNSIMEFSSEPYVNWQKAGTAEFNNRRSLDKQKRQRLLDNKLVHRSPQFQDGKIASSSVLVASKNLRDWLLDRDRKWMAVEMESIGVLAAVEYWETPVQTVVLRGMSDFADRRKKGFDRIGGGSFRRLAMNNATRSSLSLKMTAYR